MSDCLEVQIAKAMVTEIETARDAGDLEYAGFVVDYEFGNRIELQQDYTAGLPEEWLLRDDKLHMRIMIPQKPGEIFRDTRTSLAWVAHVEIDIRMKLGSASRESGQATSREELSRLGRLVEQIFRVTGYDLDETRISVTGEGANAVWIDGNPADVKQGSEILFKYHQAWLSASQFYGAIRQVFKVTT